MKPGQFLIPSLLLGLAVLIGTQTIVRGVSSERASSSTNTAVASAQPTGLPTDSQIAEREQAIEQLQANIRAALDKPMPELPKVPARRAVTRSVSSVRAARTSVSTPTVTAAARPAATQASSGDDRYHEDDDHGSSSDDRYEDEVEVETEDDHGDDHGGDRHDDDHESGHHEGEEDDD